MPALTVALDLSLRCEPRKYPVEVVGLNLHGLGELGNGDSRLLANQFDCLGGTRVTATASRAGSRTGAGTPAGTCTGSAGARAGGAGGRAARATRAAASAGQRRPRGLQARNLILQFAQSRVDVLDRGVNKCRQRCLLSLRTKRSPTNIQRRSRPYGSPLCVHDALRRAMHVRLM